MIVENRLTNFCDRCHFLELNVNCYPKPSDDGRAFERLIVIGCKNQSFCEEIKRLYLEEQEGNIGNGRDQKR